MTHNNGNQFGTNELGHELSDPERITLRRWKTVQDGVQNVAGLPGNSQSVNVAAPEAVDGNVVNLAAYQQERQLLGDRAAAARAAINELQRPA
jgi:hypothetical protein